VQLKREIIAVAPLRSYPGYWLLTGRTEGEFGTWNVIRKPNGTYWTAVIPLRSETESTVVEIGDKVTDPRAVAQFESGFVNLRESSALPPGRATSIQSGH
jgi:hypothetical protein